MSTVKGTAGCDFCLIALDGQLMQVQYSRGAFAYGDTQLRVTPDSTRLRDVRVCATCAEYLARRMDHLIAHRGRPAREQSRAADA